MHGTKKDDGMDRRIFLKATAALAGTGAAVGTLSVGDRAEALEHAMIEALDGETAPPERPPLRGSEEKEPLSVMPAQPTLLDFFEHRFAPASHVLQSATRALEHGMSEEIVLACLLHDLSVMNLVRADHGWWCAQMIEPYVPERVAWAIRYHQALRFFPDPSVDYEYPEMYVRIFGADYEPEPYLKAAHDYARNNKWYMDARSITMHDDYSFDPDAKPTIEPFTDIIGRHFRQPKEGLGFDNSPTAHMWRTMMNPRRRL